MAETPNFSPELRAALVDATNQVLTDIRQNTVSALYVIEQTIGAEAASKLAVELAAASISFAVDKATSAEDRAAIADAIRELANSVLMRHVTGHA